MGAFAVKTWSWKKRSFPSTVAILEHPTEGLILFDTGYSDAFFAATKAYPYRIYRWITSVHHSSQESVKSQLGELGIAPEEVRAIFISHFHADHLCGLRDFPNAQFICSEDAAEEVINLKGVSALSKGFLPDLIPDNFTSRTRLIKTEDLKSVGILNTPFEAGVDLFKDQSMIAIPLPGHAKGQMGLLINQEFFLLGDAAWDLEAVKANHPPHELSHLLHSSRKEYLQTFHHLHLLTKSHPNIKLAPSHCWSLLPKP